MFSPNTRRYQTTYTFSTKNGAEIFKSWLKRNCNDFARGVATGVEAATMC